MQEFTCKDCPTRHPGCHDKCEKYQAEKKTHDARNAAKREADTLRRNLDQQYADGVRRAQKKDRRPHSYR